MMIALAALIGIPIFGVFVLFGDAALAAAVAGAFSLVNTALNAWIVRRLGRTETKIDRTHAVLAAPRRAVYNDEGRIIGTVLALETEDDWPARVIPPQRLSDLPQHRRTNDPSHRL